VFLRNDTDKLVCPCSSYYFYYDEAKDMPK